MPPVQRKTLTYTYKTPGKLPMFGLLVIRDTMNSDPAKSTSAQACCKVQVLGPGQLRTMSARTGRLHDPDQNASTALQTGTIQSDSILGSLVGVLLYSAQAFGSNNATSDALAKVQHS